MRAAHTSASRQPVSSDLTRSPLQRLREQAHRAVNAGDEAGLRIVPVQDESEAQADRIAESVEGMPRREAPVLGAQTRSLQRQEQGKSGESKQPSDDEKYKEAAKKVGEAFLETEVGKNLKSEAERLGKAFLATLPGKIITGTAAAGAVSYLFAKNAELPVQIPSIPLDFLAPGLSVELTYEGPVRSPTKAMITFSYSLGGGAKASEKKPAMSEKEKYQAETERMRADQEKFRRGLMTPQQRAEEDRMFWDAFWRMKAQDPSNPLNLPGLRQKREEGFSLQRKASGGSSPARAPSIVNDVLQQPGAPLDGGARNFLENRLGHDFSAVRVHTGSQAHASAQAVRAEAYTVGNQIVFANGQYDPGSGRGLKLLAHELVHVVQQQGSTHQLNRRLIATGSDADVQAFIDLAEPAAGVMLERDPVTNEIRAVGSLAAPPTSQSFADLLTQIMDDPAQDAEVHFGTGQAGVAVGAFPIPSDLTGSTEQNIDIDDVENIEAGAPGNGIAKLAHEISENYAAHASVPAAGVDLFPASHEVGLEEESDVAEELVGPGRRVASVTTQIGSNQLVRVQDFENYYLVFDLTHDPATNDFSISNARQAPRVVVASYTIDGFATNSDVVPAAGAANIAAAAGDVNANDTSTVRIEGFTDSVGSPASNLDLSRRRAQSARTDLAAQGISRGRIHATGLGETQFVAPNDTEANRARNRRVEIEVARPGA